MKRHWIIRGLFVALLLLCVGGWGWSYRSGCSVAYFFPTKFADVECLRGKVYLIWNNDSTLTTLRGWNFMTVAATDDNDPDILYAGPWDHRYLGFNVASIRDGDLSVTVPFWFLAILFATLLWLVWRKTRPKPVGRAFPVEAKPTVEENTP